MQKMLVIAVGFFSFFSAPVFAQVGSDMKDSSLRFAWLTVIRRQMDNPFMCLPLKNARTGVSSGILLECLTGGEPHQLLPDGKDLFFTVQDSSTPKEVVILALDMLPSKEFWEVYRLYNETDVLSYEGVAYMEGHPAGKLFREMLEKAEKIWAEMPFKPE